MPFGKVLPQPGVNIEFSPTLNRTGWSSSNLMRFRMGLPEKIGGWTPLTLEQFVGTCLGMHSWAGTNGITYCMVGTDQRLEVISQGVLYDITPIRATHNPAVDFSTVIDTAVVTIVDTGSNVDDGDWVYILVPVSVGGIVLQGFYRVSALDANSYTVIAASNASATVNHGGAVPAFTTTMSSPDVNVLLANHGLATNDQFYVEVSTAVGGVTLAGAYTVTFVDADNFTIVASAPAGSSATVSENGGDARIIYLLSSGVAQNIILSGYGIGDYGAGDYGIGSTDPDDPAIEYMRQWTGDSWGGDLVCCPYQGAIYLWTPPVANILPGNELDNPAVVIAEAPSINTTLFVHSQAEILVSCGNNQDGDFDPLLVSWTDQDDLHQWTPAVDNQAGNYRLKSGSRIVGAIMVQQSGLIWTDINLVAMQYIGYPEVMGFTVVGVNCGLIAMRAVGILNTSVFWCGRDNFYIASPGGAPFPLPCTVWDFIFQNLDTFQLEAIVCAVNTLFNEVAWYFPSASGGTGSVDSYVKYNTIEQTWDYGLLARSAWDEGLVFGYPLGADYGGFVQQHETSNDANGSPIVYSWGTGFFDISDGEDFMYVDQIWPDFVETTGAQVKITVKTVDYPSGPTRIYGPYTVTQGTKQFIALNCRGRQMQLIFSGDDLGSFVRLGAVRYRYGAAGRRGGG